MPVLNKSKGKKNVQSQKQIAVRETPIKAWQLTTYFFQHKVSLSKHVSGITSVIPISTVLRFFTKPPFVFCIWNRTVTFPTI
jgi:hypothetical protein